MNIAIYVFIDVYAVCDEVRLFFNFGGKGARCCDSTGNFFDSAGDGRHFKSLLKAKLNNDFTGVKPLATTIGIRL